MLPAFHASFAFFARPTGETAKVPREWAEASDWFVLFTLGTLLFLLGCFASWAWIIWRRTHKPEPHMRLLMDLEDEAAHEQRASPKREEISPKAPWEQSPDWWKEDHD